MNEKQTLSEIIQYMAKGDFDSAFALSKQAGIPAPQLIQYIQKAAESNPAAKETMANLATWAQQNPDRYKAIMAQAAYAKLGAKLQYYKRLQGKCPEGYEMKMFKAGGQICKKCEKIREGNKVDIVTEFKKKRHGC